MPESPNSVKLPDTTKLVISSSPHVHAPRSSIRKIMFFVVLALLPCVIASWWHFGLRALWVILLTTVAAIATEAIANRLLRQGLTIGDGSAVVTGLLLALSLPVSAPEWVCVLGGVIAIGLGKMVYGGLGYNPFNPALVGRVVLLIALPSIMTTWVLPTSKQTSSQCNQTICVAHQLTAWHSQSAIDQNAENNTVITGATPLAMQKPSHQEAVTGTTPLAHKETTYMQMFLGNIPGSLGETSKLAILLGGLLLALFGIIRWQVPLGYIGTVAVITGIAHFLSPATYPHPLTQILSGGLFFAAFFMATDMVTTPLGRKGAAIFAIGCGIITAVIRLWGSYPEGVTFAILIMNALTPLIDSMTASRPFGHIRQIAKEVKP